MKNNIIGTGVGYFNPTFTEEQNAFLNNTELLNPNNLTKKQLKQLQKELRQEEKRRAKRLKKYS